MPKNNPPFKLSNYKLTWMDRCERCFWFYGREKVDPASSDFTPRFPNAVDRGVKEMLDFYRRDKDGELPAFFGKRPFRLYTNSEDMALWTDNFNGLRWKLPSVEGGHELFGAIDELVINKEGLLTVMDHKTSGAAIRTKEEELNKFKKEKADLYRTQLSTYHLILQKMGHQTTDFAYLNFIQINYVEGGPQPGELLLNCQSLLVKVIVEPEQAEERFRKGIEVLLADPPQDHSNDCQRAAKIKQMNEIEAKYSKKE